MRSPLELFRKLPGLFLLLALLPLLSACQKSSVDTALQSDAHGYLCRACNAKFYTPSDVFANRRPNCKSMQLAQAVGFVCPADHHVTIAPRGTGSMPCEKCGQPTSGLSIPREIDFQAWGAAKKTRAEVGS